MTQSSRSLIKLNSRKLWFSVFAIGALYFGYSLTEDPLYEASFRIYAAGVETITGMYVIGNAAAKWLEAKTPKAKKTQEEETAE